MAHTETHGKELQGRTLLALAEELKCLVYLKDSTGSKTKKFCKKLKQIHFCKKNIEKVIW
jgi:hypothetical protein